MCKDVCVGSRVIVFIFLCVGVGWGGWGELRVRVDGGGVDGWVGDGAGEVIGVGVWAGCGRGVWCTCGCVWVCGCWWGACIRVASVGVLHLLVTENVP